MRRLAAATLLLIAQSLWGFASADEIYTTGLKPSDPASIERMPAAQLHRGFVGLDNVDLSSRMPPPGNQGHNGTCAAWATVYGAASYYARIDLHQPDIALSPSYVFNQVDHDKQTCANASLYEIVEFVHSHGAASLQAFSDERFCEAADETARDAQPIFVASDAELISFAPYDDKGRRRVKIPFDVDLVRQRLADGNPIVVGMRTTDLLLNKLPAGAIYDYRTAADPNRKHERHAFVLIGYDNKRQAFRLMNSWGRQWSDGGYGWISYASAQSEIEEAFTLEGRQTPPPPDSTPPRPASDKVEVADETNGECAAVEPVVTPRGYELRGFVENSQQRERILAKVRRTAEEAGLLGSASVIDELEIRPWPQCEALSSLQALLSAADRPSVRTLDGRNEIRIGERFGLEVRTPDYPSFLYLIYLQTDGAAVNLLPKRGGVREQSPPGTVLRMGGPDGRGPWLVASEPAGNDAVIAIAARSPIAELEDLAAGRSFNIAADGASGSPGVSGVRRALTAINDGLRAKPLTGAAPRQAAADILLLTIEK